MRTNRRIPACARGTGALLVAAVLASATPGDPCRAEVDPTDTFSIVARDSVTVELGVAVQSRAFNVGQRVPWARAGVGAIATQASTNVSFGPRGLALLESGFDAETALELLLESDEGREHRQIGIVDGRGGVATFTGDSCMTWAGDLRGTTFVCQGNILAGEAVITEMANAFRGTAGTLAERLLSALEAAQVAGGDRRGQQSAALLVVRDSDHHPEYRERFVSLEIADHPQPIAELRRLYDMSFASHLAEAYLSVAEEDERAGRRALARTEREYVSVALEKAIRGDAPDAGSLNALAWAVAVRGLHLDLALEAAALAAELSPDSPEILDTLAEVNWRLGRIDDAVRIGTRALDLSPGDPYLEGQLRKFRTVRH